MEAWLFLFILFLMKMLVYPLVFMSLLFGCKAKINDPAPISTLKTIVLNVEVTHLYNDSLLLDSAVSNARILIYDEEKQRSDSLGAIRQLSTDSTGKVTIDFVNYEYGEDKYFIKVAHNTFGIRLYEQTLAPGSTALLKVTY